MANTSSITSVLSSEGSNPALLPSTPSVKSMGFFSRFSMSSKKANISPASGNSQLLSPPMTPLKSPCSPSRDLGELETALEINKGLVHALNADIQTMEVQHKE